MSVISEGENLIIKLSTKLSNVGVLTNDLCMFV